MPEQIQTAEMLFDKGTLIDLFIGRWTGQKKLRSSDLGLEDIDAEVIYLGHKKLLPKEALDPIISIEGKARTYLAQHSISFPLGGSAFVFNTSLNSVLKKLDEIKVEWQAALEQLLAKYPEFKEKQLLKLDAETERVFKEKNTPGANIKELNAWKDHQQKQNRQLYPTADALRLCFTFKRRMFKISAAEGVATLSEEDLAKAQDELKVDLQRWVKDATTEMHVALGMASKRAMELLEKNDKLQPRNLRPLFQAFSAFQSMDFNQGSDTLKTIEEIRKEFLVKVPGSTEADFQLTADAIEGKENHLKNLLTRMGELAVEEVARVAAVSSLKNGEFARCIDL